MPLTIINDPDPILRKKSKPIKNPLDPEIQKLILPMLETMRQSNGVGLAAPQIGKSIRLCVIEENEKIFVLINPHLVSHSRKQITVEEGCLSVPGKYFPIRRPEKVKVTFLDQTGKECKIKASGLLARALQHEIDHLDGILVIDRYKKQKS